MRNVRSRVSEFCLTEGFPLSMRNLESLICTAKAAHRRAINIGEEFRVGASVLTAAHQIYPGCNVESSVVGATVCAERSAICNAIASVDCALVVALAIYSDGAAFLKPCPKCSAYITEVGRRQNWKVMVLTYNEALGIRMIRS